MQTALTILRLIAFLLSTAGYVAFSRVYMKVSARASYLFVLSALAVAVYFAGLAGALAYAAYALFSGGIALFGWMAIRRKLSLAYNTASLTALNLVFLAGVTVFSVSLMATRFVHYDNFSHWAVVVKSMLITDRIPSAASAVIDFKTYPLGSSAFLYYFCRVVGTGEGVMLTGQAALLFASFYAAFGVIRDHRRFLLAAMLGFGFSLLAVFNISIRVNNLLVDFLLPALALGAAGAAVAERASVKRALLSALPPLLLLPIVKNTGVFFAALVYAYLLWRAVRARRSDPAQKRAVLWALAAILISLTPLVLWNVHTSLAFSGEASKFSYDFQGLGSLALDKTPEQVRSIAALFGKTVFSLGELSTRGVLLFNVLALAAYLIARFAFHKRWRLLKTLLALDAALALYYAGILGMYIVSMPLDEALRLAGFGRYASSMALFFIGALWMCAVGDVEDSFYRQQGERRDVKAFKSLATKNLYQIATVAFAAAASIVLLSELNGMNSIRADYAATLPAKVEAMVGDRWGAEDDETRYLFYATDENEQVSNYYLPYVARYFLFASQADAVSAFDEAAFMGQIQTYDTFVILESTPEIRAYMQSHASLPGDPGVYDVAATFPEAVKP